MKRVIGLMIFIPLIFILTACSASSAANGTSLNGNNSDSKTLSTIEELALGTLELEETGQAVDKTQAFTLLPLWEAYVELQGNNSTAPEEVEAVITQIKSSMTTTQMKAINDLKLTTRDFTDTMTSLGITNPSASPQGTQTASQGDNFAGGFQGDITGGSAPAGGPPSMGGGPQDGGGITGGSISGSPNLNQSQVSAPQESNNSLQGSYGSIGLIEKLISILEKRIQNS
jgi:hypothetical protein